MADEVEGKLLITASDAERIYEDAASLQSVGGFEVASRAVEEVSDEYFDNPGRELAAAEIGLRVRTLHGREFLTLKGAPSVAGGVITREEVEAEWSPEGLDAVLAALRRAGIAVEGAAGAHRATSAREALQALGYRTSGARTNRRTALTLVNGDEAVAEMDIDAVTFQAGPHTVRHYEIECESKGTGDATVVRAVIAALSARYEGVRAWSTSKLGLGDALDRLAARGELAALLHGERLTLAAYERIEREQGAS